jgi:hypothetical protein
MHDTHLFYCFFLQTTRVKQKLQTSSLSLVVQNCGIHAVVCDLCRLDLDRYFQGNQLGRRTRQKMDHFIFCILLDHPVHHSAS